jgi:hypothetical protein
VGTLTPTLSWNPSSGATLYNVALLNASTGATVVAQSVSSTSLACPALQNGVTYIWSVSASNSAGTSTPSSGVYFTVSVAPTVNGVSPSPVPASNSKQSITVNGSNFVSGATLTYYDTNNKSYPGHAATFINSTQLIDPAFNNQSDVGVWQIQVVNPDGQTSNMWKFSVQ